MNINVGRDIKAGRDLLITEGGSAESKEKKNDAIVDAINQLAAQLQEHKQEQLATQIIVTDVKPLVSNLLQLLKS